MTRTARELLETITADLAPDPRANRLVPLIARGAASRDTLAALALEQHGIIAADRRSFLHLAQRASAEDAPACAAFFRTLAEGEEVAGERLTAFARACGVDRERTAAYTPLPGCQAYPAYVAWLALNAGPSDAVLALTANFSAWGGCCATISEALRTRYGFPDASRAFFDLFAEPSPDLEEKAEAAVQEGLDTGRLDEHLSHRYGSLLQTYEAMFWTALERQT